jgi:RNA polymerase primary sigma factor
MISTKRFIETSEDSISNYLKEVRKIDLLTPEQELELTKKVAEGDKRAQDKLVNANLRFVISIAKEYQGQGVPLVDLISEGNYGLIKAATKFDHTKGFRFISYAVWWVKQCILQSLSENSRTVRLPVNITNQLSKIKKEIAQFEQENHREPNDSEMDLSVLLHPTCGSLNDKINEDGDEVLDLVADNSFKQPDEDFYGEDVLKSELEKTLSILSDRERTIINMYFGIDGQSMTLEQIGDEFSLTKERIRQIKEKALRKLKNNCINLRKLKNNCINLFDFIQK